MEKVCDICGAVFDEDEARDLFEMEVLRNYNYLTKCLCAKCAIEAINDKDGTLYYEICENCGTRFDPFEAELEFARLTGDDAVEMDMFGRYLCLDCSLDEYKKDENFL